MRLYFSGTSPFVRKVLVLAHEADIVDRIEIVPIDVWAADTDIRKSNPLGKVPALELDDGVILFDSPVICEYLDTTFAGHRYLPQEGAERWQALKIAALADGMMDASVLQLLENRRDTAQRSADWIARQQAAVDGGLDSLEVELGRFDEGVSLASITVACALGYRDFRFADSNWRDTRPRLAAWYTAFAARPSMQATVP